MLNMLCNCKHKIPFNTYYAYATSLITSGIVKNTIAIRNPLPLPMPLSKIVSTFHSSSLTNSNDLSSSPSSSSSVSADPGPGNKLMRRRNTFIKKLDSSEWEHTGVGKHRLPLLDRRGERTSVFKHLRLKAEEDKPGARTDMLAFLNADIDLRPTKIKSVIDSINAQADIKEQMYKPERVRILGSDLSAAHFIVARKGRVKFLGFSNWISKYRIDAEAEDDEDDLPALKEELCSLPTQYDPNFRLEAIDASNVLIRYEGLQNFDGLNYLNWLSFRNCTLIDDFCLDRIYCLFSETLEYLDVSNCKKITAAGLSGAWRLTNLKTLVVEDMAQVKDLEIICAMLEEYNKGLTCIGIDYEKKLKALEQEKLEKEQKLLKDKEAKEANTIEVIPVSVKPVLTPGKEAKESHG